MATLTVTQIDPRLTLIKAAVVTADVIDNDTGGTLVLCTAATVTNGTVKTLTYEAEVAQVLPGATYTILIGNNGDDIYSINLRDMMTSTVPKIVVV